MAPAVILNDDDRIQVANDDGTWTIRKRHAGGVEQGGTGPGYIHRLVRPDGTVIVDDTSGPNRPPEERGTINDPCFGGLGCFGMHVARQNEHFPDGSVYNYTWDVTGRHHAPTRAGYGVDGSRILRLEQLADRVELDVEVDLFDGEAWTQGAPLLTVRYEWRFLASRAEAIVAMTVGAGAHVGSPTYVKEPKLVAHSIGAYGTENPNYRWLDMYRDDGSLIQSFDIWSLPSPSVDTKQWPFDRRCRARLRAEGTPRYFNVIARALRSDGSHEDWEPSQHGLDGWAQAANWLSPLVPGCDAYCLQGPGGTLTRQWETARWASDGPDSTPMAGRPHTGLMLHAWEGGSGYPDCLCCFRPFPPEGWSCRAWLCFSYDAGWAV